MKTVTQVISDTLGTYSARLMARTQNGRISFTTSEIKGTEVTVTFPQS